MDEKELKTLTDSIDKKFNDLNTSIDKQRESSDDLIKKQDGILKDLVELKKGNETDKEYAEKMQEQLDGISEKLSKISLAEVKGNETEEAFKKMFQSEQYKNMKEGKGTRGSYEIKANTISTANSFTQTNSPIIPLQRDPVLGIDPRIMLPIQNLVSKGVTNSNMIDWIERTAETTGTAMKAEGNQYGQSDVAWTSYKQAVEKITDFIKVTREKLDDTDFVQSEIMDVLSFNIPNLLEYQILSGNNTSPNLSGILSGAAGRVAKTWSLPTGANEVTNPNYADALATMGLQCKMGNNATNTKAMGFLPTAYVMNPVDTFVLSRLKDSNGQYLLGMDGIIRINGVPVYESFKITQGTALVGSFNRAKLWMRKAITIEMWDQEGNDATYGLVTFTAVARYCLQLKNTDAWGFVTGTLADVVDDITKAPVEN